ncbi:signal-transduction histidine kinase senX3 [Mycobacterium avium subsp. avium 2285 (R)]|nr:signal-transduction histidine kinase senX3 [Mycobacterium avium subsp. avium 2285 (R)]
MFSALLLAGVLSVLALAAGVAVGTRLSPRAAQRRQRISTEWTGITVAQMLERIVALMPLGAAVVDAHRDVVYLNDRAKELGLVRDRQLDDQAWEAAQQALTGVDVEFDLRPAKRSGGRSGLSVHGQARLLSEEDRRFAVVFAHDQSDYARMEATRRDFVANVSHELKTPVGAMALLAEALLASADDSETVRRFAEKVLVEANRLGDMVAELIELSRLQGAERLTNVTEVDVDSVVNEAISRHKVAADNANIEVRTDAPAVCGCWATRRCWSPRWRTWCPMPSPIRRRARRCRSAVAAAATTSRSPSPTAASASRWRIRSGFSSGSSGGQGALTRHRRQRVGPGHRQARRGQSQRHHRGVEQAGHRIDIHPVHSGGRGVASGRR